MIRWDWSIRGLRKSFQLYVVGGLLLNALAIPTWTFPI